MVLVLLETKNTIENNNNLYAVDSQKVDTKTLDNFYLAGNLHGISKENFSIHSHWLHQYIPIAPVGSLKTKPRDISQKIKKVREELAQRCATLTSIDTDDLIANSALIQKISQHELLPGMLYAATFEGKERRSQKDALHTSFALVDKGNTLKLRRNKFYLDGKTLEPFDQELHYIMQSDSFIGEVSLFQVGEIEIHRRSLQPYFSTGSFGGPQSNGPWVLLTKLPYHNH
jgi:hypothetical protein